MAPHSAPTCAPLLQVNQLLAEAQDVGAILEVLPELMEPRNVMSVLVTVRKWYHNKKDPVQVGRRGRAGAGITAAIERTPVGCC